MSNITNPVCLFDFTMAETCLASDYHERGLTLVASLRMLSKKYVFQLERGESGYVHWQGRVSLIKKKRLHEAVSLFHRLECFKNVHLSVTTTNVMEGLTFNYVMKIDSWIEPYRFMDTDEQLYLPRQVREIHTLYPWQSHIIEHANDWDTRAINTIGS